MLEAHQQLARAALLEITPESTIGEPAGTVDEAEGVVSYLFEVAMNGYPGWKWTVTVANIGEGPASVLEVEMMPAEGALLAPEWIPWADRMDDYRAAQIALGEAAADDSDDDESDDDDADAADDDDDEDDESDDEDSDDEDDDDEDGDFVRPTHGGDVDGVDIDQIDESDDDPSDDDASDDGALDSEETVEFVENDETIEVESDPLPEESEELPTVEAEPEAESEPAPVEEPVKTAPRARRSRRASSADVLKLEPTE